MARPVLCLYCALSYQEAVFLQSGEFCLHVASEISIFAPQNRVDERLIVLYFVARENMRCTAVPAASECIF